MDKPDIKTELAYYEKQLEGLLVKASVFRHTIARLKRIIKANKPKPAKKTNAAKPAINRPARSNGRTATRKVATR